MSNQITEAFVQEFGNTYQHLAQQMPSRLESCVTVESGIVGMSKSINRLGLQVATKRTTRHGDTPINDTPHSTRYLDLDDYEVGDMVDDQDKIRLLVDPTSDYTKAMVSAHNRTKDDIVLSAMGGAARSAASSSVALTAGQTILVGGTGLTKAKLLQAKALFRTNEADEENGEELFIAYGSVQMTDILADTTFTSADYLAMNMLQTGTLKGKWMGFTWIPTQRCPKASTTRTIYAWAKSGVCLGIGQNIVTRVGEDPSKSFNTRVYAKQSLGAVRIEEAKVVAIQCNEP
jgi:Phage capsid protein